MTKRITVGFVFVICFIFSAGSTLAKQTKDSQIREIKSVIKIIDARLAVINELPKDDNRQTKKILKTLRAVDKKLKKIVSDKELFSSKPSQKSIFSIANEGKNKGNLSVLRSAVILYFADNEGNFPKTIKEIIPEYLKEIPFLELAGHKYTNEVKIIKKMEGEDIKPYIKDTGKWLYVSDPKSKNWGDVLIDCSHTDRHGKKWYKI